MVELVSILQIQYELVCEGAQPDHIMQELDNLKDPQYRDKRLAVVLASSMAYHRTYVASMLTYHLTIDDLQGWLLQLAGLLHNRLLNSCLSEKSRLYQLGRTIPETDDEELRLYRETLTKLLF